MAYDYDMMVRAAWMYYNDNLTHAEIARKLQLTRVKVTRMLARARELGIVEIRVTQPMPHDLVLSRQLEEFFGLESAIVVSSVDAMAQAAADILTYELKPNLHIGFGWSSTVSRIAHYITPPKKDCTCTVVDLVGSMLGKSNPYSVSGRVADALHAKLMPLPVPVMVSSAEAREAMLSEPSIAATMEAAQKVDLAFVGVGEVGMTSTLMDVQALTAAEMSTLEQQGAVGDILMHCFDIDGNIIDHPTQQRIIGVSWDELRTVANVVLMANGQRKVDALLGALRSGVINTLITDMTTAKAILDKHAPCGSK